LIVGPAVKLHVPVFTRAVTVAYPVGDTVLFGVALAKLIALAGMRAISVQHWLILAGIAGLLLADTFSAYISLNWAWYQPSSVNLGWYAWFFCWVLAALWPQGHRAEDTEEG
jgi:hypothetical protein